MISFLGWSGAILGCIGSLLMALKLPHSRYAFVFFPLANALLIVYAVTRADYPLLALNIVNTLICYVGFRRWLYSGASRGPSDVVLSCTKFARFQRAKRAAFGTHGSVVSYPAHKSRTKQAGTPR